MSLRIAIVGYGKMGRLVERLAPEHGCEVVRVICSAENGNGLVSSVGRIRDDDVGHAGTLLHRDMTDHFRPFSDGEPA